MSLTSPSSLPASFSSPPRRMRGSSADGSCDALVSFAFSPAMALLSVRRMVSSRERITSRRCVGESCDCCATAAVNLDADLKVRLLDHAAQAPDLLERCRDELLPAEAGVDGHDQNVVGELKRLLHVLQRGRGVDDYPGLRPALLDCRQSPVDVRVGLDVHGNHLRARLDEFFGV